MVCNKKSLISIYLKTINPNFKHTLRIPTISSKPSMKISLFKVIKIKYKVNRLLNNFKIIAKVIKMKTKSKKVKQLKFNPHT